MPDASTLEDMSPKLLNVVERAKREPEGRFHSLNWDGAFNDNERPKGLLCDRGGFRVSSSADKLCAAYSPIFAHRGEVIPLTPNVLAVSHWERLLGGAIYAASPRVDWPTLLKRTFDVDVLQCPKCHGRLRVLAVITEREPVRQILAHLGLPTEAPPVARARDPTDAEDAERPDQLELQLA